MRPTLQSSASALFLAAAIVPVFAHEGPGGELAALAVPSSCGFPTTTVNYPGVGGAITDTVANYTPGSYTANVSGLGPFLADVNLYIEIAHLDNQQIDVTLTSPAGTTVTITTDNGGALDNVFNGSLFDDSASATVVDHTFTNLVANTPLAPEGRLEAFRGENPNGTWTLMVGDDTTGTLGSLNGWSLTITTLAGPPTPTTTVYTHTPNVPIRDGGTVVGSRFASGLGTFLGKVVVYVEIPHTESTQVDLFLQPPSGPTVMLATDNAGVNDNIYNGTVFDGDATIPVTDYPYMNNVAAPFVGPEGGFDPLVGIDPNGFWNLIVTDDTTGVQFGSLRRWDLILTTIPTPTPSAPSQFAGTTGAIPDFVAGTITTPSVFTRNVTGAGTVLWDVDLFTGILHGAAGDLDMTLTSPAGTVVVITTDNGVSFENVFNGTSWDDDANNPVGDVVYANFATVTPLTPEGRLSAFRGEDPNGTWTLTITDDTAGDAGTLTNWALDLTTVTSLPTQVSTTVSRTGLNLFFNNGPPPQFHTDMINIAGAGTSITEVEVYMELAHQFPGDMDIWLTSPAGTMVVVTTNNSNTNDNVFNGTLFDPDSADSVTDHAYLNNVPAPLLGPEGGFDNFLGEDPTGNWTLTLSDDAVNDEGTLFRWDLTIRTCGIPPPVPYCFGDGTGTACPCSPIPVPHGVAGRGCPTNVFAGGAIASSSGVSSLAADTLLLTGTDMINGSMIFFQGPIQQTGGFGAVFGDGLRCIQTTNIRRFKTKTVALNTASYPGVGDAPISTAGAIVSVGVRNYQGWYRSANPTFCTIDTFNLTNGLSVTWGL